MTPRRPSATLAATACVMLLLAASAVAQTRPQTTAPGIAHAKLWLESVAGAMAVLEHGTLDPERPDPARVAALRQATDDLEKAVTGLLRTIPPESATAIHIAALPRLFEIVDAARETLSLIEGKDAAEIASGLDWLHDTVADYHRTITRFRPAKP